MSSITIFDVHNNEILMGADYITKTLKVLSGKCKLYKEILSKSYKCSYAYITPPNANIFSIISEEITEEEYNNFVTLILRNNNTFFSDFYDEICEFIIAEKQKQHTKAFIFIYRLLEHISYAFPMLYVAKSNDFKGTYDNIRAWASGEPLKFFGKFIEKIFSDYNATEYNITIHLPSDTSLQEKYHDLFINKVFYTKEGKKALEENDMDDKSQITFNWHFLPSLIVEIRNGFCHYLNTERPNLLDVKDFIDSDLFFNLINNECMKWIVTVFISILAESYSNMM